MLNLSILSSKYGNKCVTRKGTIIPLADIFLLSICCTGWEIKFANFIAGYYTGWQLLITEKKISARKKKKSEHVFFDDICFRDLL